MAESALKDYYPTPHILIEKLIADLRQKDGPFLEPSAGKGNLAAALRGRMNSRSYEETDLDVIEINPDFQHILKGKGFRLVHDNFLDFDSRKPYGAIVANFPFSEGDKHLAKALDLLSASGGELRCLVNAESLKNPHTNLRKALLVRLEDLNAEIEYIADAFEHAERPTDVEVALIKVSITRPAPFSILMDSLKKAEEIRAGESEPCQLVGAEFVNAIVAQFGVECDLGIKLINEYYAMMPFIKKRLIKPGEEDHARPLIELRIDDQHKGGLNDNINNFVRGARYKYWSALLEDSRFTSRYTSNILNELRTKLDELKDYDFSLFNIRELQKEMSAKVIQGVEASILALFETCSREHAYGEDFGDNIHYYNGWKTNKAHKINKKIVLPMYGWRNRYSSDMRFDYGFADTLTDMVKVFNYLSRDKVDVPQLVGNALEEANRIQKADLDLQYFRIKFFKKGTAHIWFKDLELLDKFNIFGSQRKNWLPPSYGKKRYTEMTEEERIVVDAFQGRERYEQVMIDPEFYLVDPKTLLLAA